MKPHVNAIAGRLSLRPPQRVRWKSSTASRKYGLQVENLFNASPPRPKTDGHGQTKFEL